MKEEPKVIYIERKKTERDRYRYPSRPDPAFFMRGGRLKPMDPLSGRRMTH